MNKFIFYFFLFLFSLTQSSFIFAQEPKLAFGSVYYTKSASAIQGANFSYDIYFFIDSEYGNRAAHIIISIESPKGWNVTVSPSAQKYLFNVSGKIVESIENLYIEPRPKLESVPENKEEGIYYIPSPSGKGYLQAKKVTVYVKVPQDAEIGKNFTIIAVANASYFSEIGTVMFSQSRDFSFNVDIRPPAYTETPINQSGIVSDGESKQTNALSSQSNQSVFIVVVNNILYNPLGQITLFLLFVIFIYLLMKFILIKKTRK